MTSRRHQIKLTAPTPIAEDHWTIQAACRGGKASPAHGYVLMTGADFTRLLKSAGYGGTK